MHGAHLPTQHLGRDDCMPLRRGHVLPSLEILLVPDPCDKANVVCSKWSIPVLASGNPPPQTMLLSGAAVDGRMHCKCDGQAPLPEEVFGPPRCQCQWQAGQTGLPRQARFRSGPRRTPRQIKDPWTWRVAVDHPDHMHAWHAWDGNFFFRLRSDLRSSG